ERSFTGRSGPKSRPHRARSAAFRRRILSCVRGPWGDSVGARVAAPIQPTVPGSHSGRIHCPDGHCVVARGAGWAAESKGRLELVRPRSLAAYLSDDPLSLRVAPARRSWSCSATRSSFTWLSSSAIRGSGPEADI